MIPRNPFLGPITSRAWGEFMNPKGIRRAPPRIKRLAQKFMAYRKARREIEPAPVDDFFNRDRCDARFAHFD